jgi:ATP-dependent DNA ligase
MARTLPKSKRQYVYALNTPTKALIRSFKNAEPGPRPKFIEPLFPELRDRPPNGDNWVHEIKFDGYRFQIHVGDGTARILTRRGHDWTKKAKAIAADASSLKTYSKGPQGKPKGQRNDERRGHLGHQLRHQP